MAKTISEEIDGSFDDKAITDAIYCYVASNADADEKQIVADEIAAKVMTDTADVMLIAASVSWEVAG